MKHSSRGTALVDVVLTCGLVALIAAIAIPTLHATHDRDAARMASRYLAQRLHLMRVEAIKRNVMVAMRFDAGELGRLGAYADGDGDGVLQRDIDSGTDPPLAPEGRLADYFASVSLRIVRDVPMPDGSGILAADSDPLRLGTSNLVSFSPHGSASSGTIYLAGRAGPQMGVRVLGSTGRVRVIWFDAVSREWREE